MKMNQRQTKYPSVITKKDKKSEAFGWMSKLMIILSVLVLFAIYCQITFPENLKSYVPQKFNSHPVRDLSIDVIPLDNNAYTHFNDPLVSLCEDVEIGHNNIAYCVNERSQIIAIDPQNNSTKKLGQAQKGISYGARLSKDQKKFYFVNSELGLCQFDLQSKEVKSLVSEFQGKFLSALNSIEINPNNPNILYITQSNPNIPMHLHTIDILLNNPFGRVYQFNKETNQITLLADGLYFANGVVHQMYKGQETILVAESNRFRLIRVYLNGQKRGQKEVAVDKLDIYLDNMKANEKGEIWVAGPSLRDNLSYFADHNPWIKGIISRLPPWVFPYLVNASLFGGLKITFANNNQQYSISYYLWNCLPNFTFATTLIQKDNKLFISSLVSKGILVFDNQDSIKKDHVNQKVNESVEENL